MSLVEDAQELIEVAELIGRKVKVYPHEYDNIEGTLHSITNHGKWILVN